MASNRLPTMESALAKLTSAGLKIDTIIDVGILTGTGYLIRNFPKAFHHLFEPIDLHDAQIAANYKSVNYELNHVAVSSESGKAYQLGISRDGSGKTTHSHLVEKPALVGDEYAGARITECRSIIKVTLDAHFAGKENFLAACLVKIDVDGQELSIIRGAQKVLSASDVVIVEATMTSLVERAAAVQTLGFQLIEIVDLCYYHDTLSQVDLIFARRDLLEHMPDLTPWSSKQFSPDAWVGLSQRLTS